jgi:flagellar biosynthesis/type III secretory pathway protein FliH
MTYAEIIQRGLDIAAAEEWGRHQGFDKGWDAAMAELRAIDAEEMDATWEDGWQDGYDAGFEEGFNEGVEKGSEDGAKNLRKAWDRAYLAGSEDAIRDPELNRKTVQAIQAEAEVED